MSQMKWTDGCDALVDFVEEHGGSMGGETREHLFDIVQNIIDGQVVGCNLDGDGYCSTHASWRCFPNLGEVAGVKTSPSPAPSVGELEWEESKNEFGRRQWQQGPWTITEYDGPVGFYVSCTAYDFQRAYTLESAKSLANSLQRILSGAAE